MKIYFPTLLSRFLPSTNDECDISEDGAGQRTIPIAGKYRMISGKINPELSDQTDLEQFCNMEHY